jgi:pimeloyl-ACP methyl ester carboxylesterase
MSSRTVTLWDPPITAKIFESGDGEPVLFFHSGSGITPSDPLVAALAATGRKVIAPRHPGFVDPDELIELRDVHDLALYTEELIEKLGLHSVPVIGHSFGGMVAAEFAAHYPTRVSKLVLAAPLGLWNDDYPVTDFFTAFPFGMAELLWADATSPEAVASMTAMAQGDDEEASQSDDPLTAMMLRVLPGLVTLGKYIWPLPDKGLSRRLRLITPPTLIVWGEKDKLTPSQYADDFVKGIGDARAEFIPDAGHMAPYERTADFVKLVDAFLSE